MKNKGFTALELVIVLTFSLAFIYTAIFIPTELIKNYKEFQVNLDNTLSVLSMSKAILNDVALSDGTIRLNNEDVLIGNSRYMFLEDGVYRINNRNLALSKEPYKCELSEDVFIISGEGLEGYPINLKYNKHFSSFPGDDFYE